MRCSSNIYGHWGGLSTSIQASDGHEANGFHVTTALQPVGFAIVFGVIPDMGVTGEELYRDVPLLFSDCLEDTGELLGAERDMTDDKEQVDLPISYSFLKPLLFDGLLHPLDDGVVRITSEVEDEAKS